MSDDKPTPHHLWHVLRAYIEHACTLMGLPQALAARYWLNRADHRFFSATLRVLETLLRRLVFLEAITLKLEPAPPEQKRQARRAMPARAGAAFDAAFDADHPETWRTRFSLATSERRLSAGPARPRPVPPRLPKRRPTFFAAAPLALRLEALIRGFNDPAPLARRLARALQRLPRIAARFCAKPGARAATHPLALSAGQAADLCRAALAAADTS